MWSCSVVVMLCALTWCGARVSSKASAALPPTTKNALEARLGGLGFLPFYGFVCALTPRSLSCARLVCVQKRE